jgi:midasin
VLAIDDSRSMAENGCGAFALEALTLLCRAMSRLEVGEVGALSFGGASGVRPLQPLGSAFGDAAGPGLMARLRFDQDNTIADRPMAQLVEALDYMLDAARLRASGGPGGGGGSDLSQLVLVLADGRFHEKEGLRAGVRRLLEKRGVCVAFIALDSVRAAPAPGAPAAGAPGGGAPGGAGAGQEAAPPAVAAASGGGGGGSSLLDMQSVKFVNGAPVFERYLDSFPFPFYIVLRDIAALPRTLADLLRQWFELSAAGA